MLASSSPLSIGKQTTEAMEIKTPLGNCRTCNYEVAVGAATCPNSGSRRPTNIRTQSEQYAAIILCILPGWATFYVVGNWDEIKSDYNRVKRQSDELQASTDETDRLKRLNERWDAVHGTRPMTARGRKGVRYRFWCRTFIFSD